MAAFKDSALPILVIVTGFEINGSSGSEMPLPSLPISIIPFFANDSFSIDLPSSTPP
jgi:hypothetical protein